VVGVFLKMDFFVNSVIVVIRRCRCINWAEFFVVRHLP